MPKAGNWRMNPVGPSNPWEARLNRTRFASENIKSDSRRPVNFPAQRTLAEGRQGDKNRGGGGRNDDGAGGETNVIGLFRRQAAGYILKKDVQGLARMMGSDSWDAIGGVIESFENLARCGRESHSLMRALLKALDWDTVALQKTALIRQYTCHLVESDDMEGMRLIMDAEGAMFAVVEGVRKTAYAGADVKGAIDELECRLGDEDDEDFWEIIPTVARHAIRQVETDRVERLLFHRNFEARRQMIYWLNNSAENAEDMDPFLPIVEKALSENTIYGCFVSPKMMGMVEGFRMHRCGSE